MPKAAAHGVHTHAGRGLPLRRLPAMDLPFLVLVLTLVGFGLVMLGSASSAVALYRRNVSGCHSRKPLSVSKYKMRITCASGHFTFSSATTRACSSEPVSSAAGPFWLAAQLLRRMLWYSSRTSGRLWPFLPGLS